jgi:hypothetical protein
MTRTNRTLFFVLRFALALLALVRTTTAQSQIIAWGDNSYGQCSPVPPLPPGESLFQVDTGVDFTFARSSAGSLIAWGDNSYGECTVPVLPTGVGYVEVSGGGGHAVAILSDGTAIAWGRNSSGQCNVPPLSPPLTYARVAAGALHTVAAVNDGTLRAWGDNAYGQCTLPVIPPGRSVVRLAAGALHTLALLDDGNLIAWGSNAYGQCDVPSLHAGLAYVQIAAGESHSAAVRSDGTLVAWGSNASGELNVIPPPPGLGYTAVAAGGWNHLSFTAGLLGNGMVVAWGDNSFGQCNVPTLPEGEVFIEIEWFARHSVARTLQTRAAFCFGDGSDVRPCPCGNNGSTGHGCENSAATGGALLTPSGTPSLSSDSFALTASGERATALSIFLQGDVATAPAFYGDGLRCVGGVLKRLFARNALGGVVIAPQAGDPSISARSAALGDPISMGDVRHYQVRYRDPMPSFCPDPPGNTWNVSNGISVLWLP